MLLSQLVRITRTKYNALRLYVFYQVTHHAALQKYIEEYRGGLRYAERYHPQLIAVATARDEPTLIVAEKVDILPDILPNKVIRGVETYYRYAAVKAIMTRVLAYDSELARYLSVLENVIFRTIWTMLEFRQFYVQFIIVNREDIDGGGAGEITANRHLMNLGHKLTGQTLAYYKQFLQT